MSLPASWSAAACRRRNDLGEVREGPRRARRARGARCSRPTHSGATYSATSSFPAFGPPAGLRGRSLFPRHSGTRGRRRACQPQDVAKLRNEVRARQHLGAAGGLGSLQLLPVGVPSEGDEGSRAGVPSRLLNAGLDIESRRLQVNEDKAWRLHPAELGGVRQHAQGPLEARRRRAEFRGEEEVRAEQCNAWQGSLRCAHGVCFLSGCGDHVAVRRKAAGEARRSLRFFAGRLAWQRTGGR